MEFSAGLNSYHKVIDPLFLDDLKAELEDIKALKVEKTRRDRLQAFRKKLSTLVFLDPAAGSGNFLTETYISLRRLENDALYVETHGQMMLGDNDVIQVSIGQFYGIEINDFAVTVAKTALWIAESQMMQETETLMQINLDFLPLKSYANIVEGNALRTDWESVVDKSKLSYIMGNPPFVGYTYQSADQKADLSQAVGGTAKNIDYVSGWYYLAARLMQGTGIRTAFVSTNSITQGEQVAAVWKPLYEKYHVHIDYAHGTFRWDSEASLKAHVHCVIVGFSTGVEHKDKLLYISDRYVMAQNINPYLVDADTVFIEKRTKPISHVPMMCKGSQPTDGGNFILSVAERDMFLKSYPDLAPYIKRFMGADEFINNKFRYCFWLKSITPSIIRKCKPLMERVEGVKATRAASTKAATREWANKPTLFTEDRQPESNYIIVPSVSSEQRRYVPIGFVSADVVASNLVLIIPNAVLYHFGVLTSNVHMAWMRVVAGRLKSDYRYSNTIVYNNFPWCEPTDKQKTRIEHTAQMILDARAKYSDCSLADLYDETVMPHDLRTAHQLNDRAVMEVYGFWGKLNTESECVAELMRMYQRLTEG